MFNFLKKLFLKEEAVESTSEEIKVDELSNWLDGKANKIFSDLDVKIRELISGVKEKIVTTKDSLAILGTAQLHNSKISVREKQFMEGNRKAYILAVNTFLRGIDIEGGDYSTMLQFCDDFNLRLDKFGKSTVRPYHILQEFFAHESRNIAINIKDLSGSIMELNNSIKKANINKINNVKNNIAELNNNIKKKTETDAILADKEKDMAALLKNKEGIEKDIHEMVKSKSYAQLNDLKSNKEIVLVSIREHNAKVIHAFSVMERSLKKLMRVVVEDSELLTSYIDNPIAALMNDSNLKIIGLLNKLENNINNLTLELKDKKREKVLETVKGLTEEFLREFINRHNELNDKLEILEKEIKDNETLKKENKLNYELSNVTDNLEKIDNEIMANRKELEKINIDEMKNNLGKEINELLKIDVIIS